VAANKQKPEIAVLQQHCWKWIGHTQRKPATNNTRQALRWNPQRKTKRGRPRNTWHRDLENHAKKTGCTLVELERLAQDREG
jgi:hypothetical protein